MKVVWWSCVLALFCMSTEVKLQDWTVSQAPVSISFIRVNSSTEISCSTSLSNPVGLYVYRQHHVNKTITYLSLKNGQVTKMTAVGKIHVSSDPQTREGLSFTVRLIQLEMSDTDLYYCTWTRFISDKATLETRSSNGTIIVVRGEDSQEQCKHQTLDVILIILTAAAFTSILILISGMLIFQCTKLKKDFRPSRTTKTFRPHSPQNSCLQHTAQCHPYMATSVDHVDYREIL